MRNLLLAALMVLCWAVPAQAQKQVSIAPPRGGVASGLANDGTGCTVAGNIKIQPTSVFVLSVVLTNMDTANDVKVGDCSSQSYTIPPGGSFSFDTADLAEVCCDGQGGTVVVEWFAVLAP